MFVAEQCVKPTSKKSCQCLAPIVRKKDSKLKPRLVMTEISMLLAPKRIKKSSLKLLFSYTSKF